MKNVDFPKSFKKSSLKETYERISNPSVNGGELTEAGDENSIRAQLETVGNDELSDIIVEAYDEGMTFDELEDAIQNRIYEQEIIYYRKAMEYLMENDDSLTESLELASNMGYTPDKLNSEILATLLYQQNLQEQWGGVRDEVETIFDNAGSEED